MKTLQTDDRWGQHMTSRDDFTEDEWALVLRLPGLVLGACALADGRNVVALMKEASAGGSTLTEEVAKYPGNPIIASFTDGSMNAPDTKSTEEAVTMMMAEVAEGFALVRTKATAQEASEVAAVLTAVATAVVGAAGQGMFGGGADKVDPREQAVLDALAGILAGG